MINKRCCKCKETIPLSMFWKDKSRKDGLHNNCKACGKQLHDSYYKRNKDKCNDKAREYYNNNKTKYADYTANYYKQHKEECNKRSKVYYNNNKEHLLECSRKYHEEHKDEIRQKQKEYVKNNIERHREYYRRYNNKVRGTIQFRIKNALTRRIKHCTMNKIHRTDVEDLIGCSIIEFRQWIESWFKEAENNDMTWENYGNGKDKWNIDHIIPCSKFDLQYSEEQEVCFHYTNMQPMWSINNSKKCNRGIY